jgi:hypothetical protein
MREEFIIAVSNLDLNAFVFCFLKEKEEKNWHTQCSTKKMCDTRAFIIIGPQIRWRFTKLFDTRSCIVYVCIMRGYNVGGLLQCSRVRLHNNKFSRRLAVSYTAAYTTNSYRVMRSVGVGQGKADENGATRNCAAGTTPDANQSFFLKTHMKKSTHDQPRMKS